MNGCTNSTQVLVDEPTKLNVILRIDIEIQLGDSIQLNAIVNTSDLLTYEWIPELYLSCADCPNPVSRPHESISYSVTITDENVCQATDDVSFIVDKSRNVYIPNAFTPNNDGINDLLVIYGDPGVAQVKLFRIYDRWGERLFEGQNFQPNNPAFGWGGNFKNEPLNPAVFVYYAEVEFIDGEIISLKGDVTLIK